MRRLKRGGIQLSAAVLTAALAGGMLSGSLPGIPARAIPPAVGVMGAGLVMYVGALFFQNEGQLHCVWHSSQLHFELGVPPCWVNSSMVPQLPDAAIAVRTIVPVLNFWDANAMIDESSPVAPIATIHHWKAMWNGPSVGETSGRSAGVWSVCHSGDQKRNFRWEV